MSRALDADYVGRQRVLRCAHDSCARPSRRSAQTPSCVWSCRSSVSILLLRQPPTCRVQPCSRSRARAIATTAASRALLSARCSQAAPARSPPIDRPRRALPSRSSATRLRSARGRLGDRFGQHRARGSIAHGRAARGSAAASSRRGRAHAVAGIVGYAARESATITPARDAVRRVPPQASRSRARWSAGRRRRQRRMHVGEVPRTTPGVCGRPSSTRRAAPGAIGRVRRVSAASGAGAAHEPRCPARSAPRAAIP